MSFFDSFIAGAATAGVGIIDQQQKAAEEERMLKLRAEIEEKKQEALEKMREDRARERDLRAGKEIEEKANLIGTQAQPGRDQIQASSNAEVGKLSEQDKIELANATPEQRADLGIINGRTRAQIADDKATAATDLGYFNHANTYRQQQQLELGRAREERMEKSDEQKTDTANRHWALQYEHQEKQTAETIRHNKELERRAAEKSAAEKLSPAAKAALELASNGLSASQIELKQAAAEKSRIATKDYMDPGQKSIDIADADKRYAAAQKEYLGSRKFYNATMSTYLDGYKPVEVEVESPSKEKKNYPTAPPAAIADLMKDPSLKDQFTKAFGEGQVPFEFYKKTQPSKPSANESTALQEGFDGKEKPKAEGERNPYVDEKGRPLPYKGGDSSNALERTVIPAVKSAAKGAAEALGGAAEKYLKAKIDRGEKLSPSEEREAKRLNLI